MLKKFSAAPLFSAYIMAMACFGYYSVRIAYRFFCFVDDGFVGSLFADSLIYGCSVAMVRAAFDAFARQKLYLLGTSLVYGGAALCALLSHFSWRFIEHVPSRLRWGSDYSTLLIISLSLLVLHLVVYVVSKREIPDKCGKNPDR